MTIHQVTHPIATALVAPISPLRLRGGAQLCLPAPPAPPLLTSGPSPITGLLPAPSSRTLRAWKAQQALNHLLVDVVAELAANYPGVDLDLTLIPRDGRFMICRRSTQRGVLKIQRRAWSVVFSPPKPRDSFGIPTGPASWTKTYDGLPSRDSIWQGLTTLINRHNAKGGFYRN